MRRKLVVMASGAGSTFKAMAEAVQAGTLSAELVGLIASREEIGAIEFAKQFRIPSRAISPKNFTTREEWDHELTNQVKDWQPDFVALAGFTLLLGPEFLKTFEHRVVNTHPSLLPKYGGRGMYGAKVHEAVIANQERETGITVHMVTAEYDEGPIVAQKKIAVDRNDSATTLAERLKAIEKEFYIEVLNNLLAGQSMV